LLRYLWKQKTNKKQKMTKISKTRQNKLFVGHKFNLVSQWCFVRFWRLCSTFWKACLFPIRKQKNIFREKFFFHEKSIFFETLLFLLNFFLGNFELPCRRDITMTRNQVKKKRNSFTVVACGIHFCFEYRLWCWWFDVGDDGVSRLNINGTTTKTQKKKNKSRKRSQKAPAWQRLFFLHKLRFWKPT
jgi:hypothetical protein